MKKLCSMPGCDSEVADSPVPQFIREVGIVNSAMWKRKEKDLRVLRSHSATCPTHGGVTAIGEGHHCNHDSVEYEATEVWQSTAIAEMMLRDQRDFIEHSDSEHLYRIIEAVRATFSTCELRYYWIGQFEYEQTEGTTRRRRSMIAQGKNLAKSSS